MKKTILIFYAVLSIARCMSQSVDNPVQFPKMSPPSPEAAALGRYGEFPVTLATGTPDISIPLYEINTGKLKLPISINYHASGIRVNDIASRVGLGWSLQAGGAISRVVKGLPDDNGSYGYYYKGIPPLAAPAWKLQCFENNQVIAGVADGEPDIFYYDLPGKSGRFVFTNRQSSGNTPVPVTIPYDLIRINLTSDFNQIEVTNTDGTLYVFGTSLGGSRAYEVTTAMSTAGATYPGSTSFTSAWYLTEIVSADKADTIKLKYTAPYYVAGLHFVSTTLKDDISDIAHAYVPHYVTSSVTEGHNDVNQIRLSEIDFRNGKVSIDYSTSGRLDETVDSCMVGLRVYQLNTSGYTQIKRYAFYQSYFNCRNIAPPPSPYAAFPGDASKRLRLDSLQEVDINGVTKPGYSFGYVAKQLPNLASYAQDLWGFYNAANNSNLLIYNVPAIGNNANPPSTTYGANRNVNPDSIDAGMLNNIRFPTGGYSTFQYECNKLGSTNVGGLRIKKIVSYDGLGGGTTKTYNYYNPNPISNLYNGDISAFGALFQYPFTSNEPYSGCCGGSWTRTYTFYQENLAAPIGTSSGAAVSYGQVEELYDSSNGTNGKAVYTYDVTQDASPSIVPQNTVTYEWKRGLLLTEKKYKSISPGTFVLLASKQNIYTYNDRPSLLVNSLACKANHLEQYAGSGAVCAAIDSCNTFCQSNTFNSVYNPMVVGNNYLTQVIDTVFDQNGSNPQIRTVNYYFDDTVSIQPTRIQTVNSKGDTLKTFNWTPLEKASINAALSLTGTASIAIDSLISKNIISPLIDQEKYYGPTLTGRTRTNYSVVSPNLVAPANIQLQIGSNPIETRVNYKRYDSYGNVVSGGKTNDALTTYIWDYQNSFVIAEVTNADAPAIAYTSFEADGTGNWTISDTSRIRLSALTGAQSYNLVSGKSISATVPSGNPYIISYWSQSGALSVSTNGGSMPVTLTGLKRNGWTYYEHLLPNSTSSVTLTASNALIDELRLYPQNAQMVTYTYNALVGVSSVCSANNSVTYYDYDNFGRLKTIRNMDKNVLRTFDYEYHASPHTFTNGLQVEAFTRVCASCMVGSTVTDTVQPGTYTSVISQADADQQAINYLNSTGQAYANTYGTCSSPGTAPISGSNGTTNSMTIQFTNSCPGSPYNFTLNVTTGTSIGPVPVGTYNISISPVGGGSTNYTFIVDGFVQNGTFANFSGITLSGSSNTIIIHP